MNAMTEPVSFALPKKPRIKEREPMPDQRKFAVIPIRACTDKQITHGMHKTLILICSYMNRSGITWVSQQALAAKLGITQQAISKHLVKLTKAGYLEVVKKAVPGARHTTWRVIFDPTISAEDAVSITSSIEDTRPPYMKEQQAMEADRPDPEGQRRVAQAISKVLKQPPKRIKTMPKSGETVTVRNMKAAIQKAQSKGTHAQPPEVVQPAQPHTQPQPVDNSVHAQPFDANLTTPRGCTEHREHTTSRQVTSRQVVKEVNLNNQNSSNLNSDLNRVLRNQEVEELIAGGISVERISEHLDTLLPLYAAEGIKPSSATLMAGIRQLQADAR